MTMGSCCAIGLDSPRSAIDNGASNARFVGDHCSLSFSARANTSAIITLSRSGTALRYLYVGKQTRTDLSQSIGLKRLRMVSRLEMARCTTPYKPGAMGDRSFRDTLYDLHHAARGQRASGCPVQVAGASFDSLYHPAYSRVTSKGVYHGS
jgi:hypothetical protein